MRLSMKNIPGCLILALVLSAFGGAVSGGVSQEEVSARVGKMMAEAKSRVESISVADLQAMIDSGQTFALLDVRTEAEYEQGHVAHARWMPRGMLELDAAKGKVGETDDYIIVYCRKDGRAALAAKTLTELGFDHVKYLEGGFEAWVKAGKSIYNRHGELIVKAFERPESEE